VKRRASRGLARTLGAVLLAGIVCLAGLACAPGARMKLTGEEAYADGGGEATYRRALRRWTREIRLYDKWSTSLLMKATFKSDPFRRAWSHEYARRYVLPQEDYALMLERELEDASRYHEVQFAVWADDSLNGHFTGQSPPWKIRLVGDQERTVEPLVLKRIRRPTTEMLRLFPYISAHDRVFVAKFPVLGPDGMPLITPSSRQVRLQVAGVVNQGELVWDLKGP
jgi:hypothetical protein